MPKSSLILLFAATLLTGCGEPEDTRPGQPVKTRQVAFKEIIKAFEPMGVMLRNDRYDAEKFAQLNQSLMARRDAPWSHFGADTDYPPTKATAEVWRQPRLFEEKRQQFIQATDKLSEAVASQDRPRIEAAYQATYETCQSCHKIFRKR